MKFDPSVVQTHWTSPLGDMHLAASRHGLAGVWFVDQQHLPDHLQGDGAWPTVDAATMSHPVLHNAISQLTDYFAGQRTAFDLPLDLQNGTAFQQSVWRELVQIPFGRSISYGDISQRIGNPKAVRAVGAAVGRNPIGLIVPCHRVLGSDGSLTGYAGGLDRKTALLVLEGVAFKPTPPSHTSRLAQSGRSPQKSLPFQAPLL